ASGVARWREVGLGNSAARGVEDAPGILARIGVALQREHEGLELLQVAADRLVELRTAEQAREGHVEGLQVALAAPVVWERVLDREQRLRDHQVLVVVREV